MAKYKPKKNKKSIVKNNKVNKLQDIEGGNFGNYNEATGGGHPFKAGDTNTRTTRENGKIRQSENPQTNQPRTNDGKFTYKSVNGQSIDPKYGPSRGKTINPLLTQGENGVYIKESTYDHDVYSNGKIIHKKGDKIVSSGENVEKQWSEQSGAYWDKYKDKWYTAGGKVVTEGLQTKVSAQTVWEMAKEYDSELGEFKGEGSNWSAKTGKKSAAEKAAAEKVQSTGKQQYAIDASTGAIETKGGMKKAAQEFAKKKNGPVEEEKVETETKVEEKPAEAPAEDPTDKESWGSGKYNKGQKKNVLGKLKSELGDDYDPNFWEDEATLEEFIDANPEVLN